jgi:cytochrome c553
MRAIKVVVPVALVLLTGLLVSTTASYGKQEYAKKEGKNCVFCHGKVEGSKEAMNKNLTEAGKYYKDHDHKLEGYKGK